MNRDYPLAESPNMQDRDPSSYGKKTGKTSASAEKDYARADSARKVIKGMSDDERIARIRKGEPGNKLHKMADSLEREGDRKTLATGGIPRRNRM